MSSVPRDGSDRKGPAETAGWKKTDAAKVSSSPSKAKEKHDGSSVSSLDKSKSRGKSKNSHGGDPMMKDSHRGSPVMKTAKSKHDSSVKGGEKRTAPEERGSPTVVKKAKTATQMLVVSVDVEPKEEENDGDEDLTGDETEKVGKVPVPCSTRMEAWSRSGLRRCNPDRERRLSVTHASRSTPS